MRALTITTEIADSKKTKSKATFKTRTASKILKRPKITVAEIQEPKIGSTDILIKIRASGLCGSDVAMTSEDKNAFVQYPFMMSSLVVPGHEFAGTVEVIGSEVKKYWSDIEMGDPVTAQCVINCGFCPNCKIGKFDSCSDGDELGFTKNGAMSEYCVVDMRHVWSLKPLMKQYDYDNLYIAGSLVEPHAGVYKAITENGFQSGSNVLIIGAGPIGLAALNIFKALGAAKIIVAEPSENRRTLAQEFGAYAFDPIGYPMNEVVMSSTNSRGVSFIFEAAGVSEKNWPMIISLLEQSGNNPRLIFFGQSKEEVPVNPQLFIQHYAYFSGSHGHTKVWPQVIELIGAGRIKPLPMTTKRISLDEAPNWLEELRGNKKECKVTITQF